MSSCCRALLVFCSTHKTYFVSRLVLALFKASLPPPLVVAFYITLSRTGLNRYPSVQGRGLFLTRGLCVTIACWRLLILELDLKVMRGTEKIETNRLSLTLYGPCIVINLSNKNQRNALSF